MGKKLESNFKNMVLVLFSISLIASAAVAGVNALTFEKIEAGKQLKQIEAIRNVVPDFDNDPMAETYKATSPDGSELEMFPAKKDGKLVGTAVKTFTGNGFSGLIWLMVGFTPDGTIYNYSVLEHKETPGLGSKMDVWFVKGGKGDITGKNPGQDGLKVSKDGGSIDAITAATISSRAFLEAVNKAYNSLSKQEDAASGATSVSEGSAE